MQPVTGRAIIDEYDTVVVNDETYDVEWTFTLSGPNFYNKVPVYASDNILGMKPVPVETGWKKLRGFLRESKEKRHYE